MTKKVWPGLTKGIEIDEDGVISFLERMYGARYFEMTEQSADPPAPAAGRVRIYPRDDGDGNTELVIRFNTGAVVVLATQGSVGAYLELDCSNDPLTGPLEIDSDVEGEPVLTLGQGDDDDVFVNFVGTSAADQAKSISTADGDGAMTGPHEVNLQAGWEFEGMARVEINGVMKWVAYYVEVE